MASMATGNVLRCAVISCVNVKFLRFTYALSIALAVGLLTLAGIGTITYFLVTTCTLVCNSTPLALLATQTASKLSCVGFRTSALQLSINANEQSRQLFHDVLGAPGNPSVVWAGFVWGSSSAMLGKCSFLHATDCGLLEWLATFQGLVAISRVANTSNAAATAAAAAAADWPSLTTFYSSSSPLDDQQRQLMAAAQGTTRLTAAGVQALLTASGATLSSNTSIFAAPVTAACCDITTEGTKLGEFGGGSSRFVINLKGHKGFSMSMGSCSTNSSSRRCSYVEVNAAMVLPPANQVQQRICSEWYNQQAGTYSAPIGMSASVCQMLPEATSSNSSAPPAQHYVCLNGTINNVQLNLHDYYTISGSCPNATHPAAAATAAPKPWPAQQLAATTLLLPLAHEFGMAMAAYMADAQVDIAAASQGLSAVKNDNEAASWWLENYIYCCHESCNSWLSSIGSALGYEAYLEAAVAVIVIVLYLAAFKSERHRLSLTLKDIKDIAFETTEVAAGQGQGATAQISAGNTSSPGAAAETRARGCCGKGEGGEAMASKEAGKLMCPTCGSCSSAAGGRASAQLQRPGSRGNAAVKVAAWADDENEK